MAAFRRKAGGVVRQLPRRPIARALGHRPDILRLVGLLFSRKVANGACMTSRNKELVVQLAGSGSIDKEEVGVVPSNAT